MLITTDEMAWRTISPTDPFFPVEQPPIIGPPYDEGDRPKFKPYAEKMRLDLLGTPLPAPLPPLCHSISYYSMLQVFLNFVKTPDKDTAKGIAELRYILCGAVKPLKGKGVPLSDATKKFLTACKTVPLISDAPVNLTHCNSLLKIFNSCPANLRLPTNHFFGAKWNSSIGNSYDPRLWCYVDTNGKVVADQSSRKLNIPLDPGNYNAIFNATNPKQLKNDAFYLLSEIDHHFIRGILAAENYFSITTPFSFSIVSGMENITGSYPFIGSSNNEFDIPPQQPSGAGKSVFTRMGTTWVDLFA